MAIQKRSQGRYEVAVEFGFDATSGKRLRRFKSVTGTRKQAEAVEREMLSERDRGIAFAPATTSVAQFLNYWLDEYGTQALAPSTLIRYRIAVEKHIIPHLGTLHLRDLRPLHVQQLHRRCRDEGLAPATIRQHHRVLARALKLGVQWQLLPSNPAGDVNAPRVARAELPTLSAEQAQSFLDAAQPDRMFPFAFLALQTGARNGELCGLRWSDIDLDNCRLSIRRTAQRIRGEGLLMQPTKTHRSQRPISLSPLTVSFLTRLRREQYGNEAPRDNYVLRQESGAPYEPRQVSVGFRRIRELTGLPHNFRFHDLRHSNATLLMMAGLHPKVVSERLGHATVSITLDVYSHVVPSMQTEAAEAMDRLLTKTYPTVQQAGES
ncbi:MAG: tyrosine-type recombinase/integrase [Dehalococcoidia bacterium]